MSLFGTTNSASRPSLFGPSLQVPQQTQQTPGSLFGSSFGAGQQLQQQQPQAQQQNNPFNNAQIQPQQQSQTSNMMSQASNPQAGLFSGFGNTLQGQSLAGPNLSLTQQDHSQQRSSLGSVWQPGSTMSPREKTVPEQMQLLLEKWSPESNNCLFQHYFYNDVPPEHVPYYHPQPGEDETKWEEALSKKPSEGSIPVLCKGFSSLGHRLRIQVQAVAALQVRVHEIHNSLVALRQTHDLDISVRTMDSRRKHIALSQRCLQLATKVQILRNRGYAMDGPEEELRRKLTELERSAFDPQLSSRQEEIWARLVGIRERVQFLQEEAERIGKGTRNTPNIFDEETVKRTTKILNDYESQISHIQRETDEIQREFEEGEKNRSS